MADVKPEVPPYDAERLTRLFKASQIGGCVNSVTHDVNNYLGAMLAYTELIGLETEMDEESARMAKEIVSAIRKSSKLLGTLTSIARPEKPYAAITDVLPVVERVVELRTYDMKVNQIDFELNTDPDAISVVVDEPMLIRAFLYIINNSIEAVSGLDLRRLQIEILAVERGVEVAFRDSAPPIPPAEREVIFEPFYTTKGEDHLGLGLSQARETARLHKGDLVYDEARGFVFRLDAGAQS